MDPSSAADQLAVRLVDMWGVRLPALAGGYSSGPGDSIGRSIGISADFCGITLRRELGK